MKFRMSGEIKLGSGKRKFRKEVEAESERHALEVLCQLLGAQNGVKRKDIKVAHAEKVA